MKIYINHKISGEFREKINALNEIVRKNARDFLALENAEIYVSFEPNSPRIFREATISADTTFDGAVKVRVLCEDFDETEYISVLLHELNHAKYHAKTADENRYQLMNFIFAEGLAENFELEISRKLNLDLPNYIKNDDFSDSEYRLGLRRILDAGVNWDFEKWFYNSNENPDFPKNYGYKIGRKLIAEFCKKHGISAHEAVSFEFRDFEKFLLEEAKNA